MDHAGGSVHHGPVTRGGGTLTGASTPAALGHGGLPAVVRKGEGSTGSSFQSSLGLGTWRGSGSSEGMAQRQSSLVRGVLKLGERRRRVMASAVVAGVVLAFL
jgi:hypothetical protein